MPTSKLIEVLLGLVASVSLAACAATSPMPTATATAVPLPSPTATAAMSLNNIRDDMPYEQAVHLFDYDRNIPFEVKEFSAPATEEGVTVLDLLYTAHSPEYGSARGWTLAYLVRPEGEGPFPGVLFMHWLGGGVTRDEFLDEAKGLAKQGVISLLIEGYFPWAKTPKAGEADRLQVIEQTIEIRRALDFLLTQPGIDPERIAYVGHDYGGMYGGVLSGLETRVKAYVLMAAPGNFSDWSVDYFLSPSVDEKEYRKQMGVVEPTLYISHAGPAAFLFQFSDSDGFVPEEKAKEFFDAASGPKEIKWYHTSHRLDAAAQADRLAWLAVQLDLPAAP